jgi:hypothetical protein
MIDIHTHILPPGWPDLGERCTRFERVGNGSLASG